MVVLKSHRKILDAQRVNFTVQIAETRNYEIQVRALTEAAAREEALKIWREAPEVGGWEIADTETEVVAITRNHRQP